MPFGFAQGILSLSKDEIMPRWVRAFVCSIRDRLPARRRRRHPHCSTGSRTYPKMVTFPGGRELFTQALNRHRLAPATVDCGVFD